jgi:hypothetical protein
VAGLALRAVGAAQEDALDGRRGDGKSLFAAWLAASSTGGNRFCSDHAYARWPIGL